MKRNIIKVVLLISFTLGFLLMYSFRKPDIQVPQTKYLLISARSGYELQKLVNDELANGYSCTGGIIYFLDDKGKPNWVQPLVK